MQQNPFAPHSPAAPGVFVDREREVELIVGHIKAGQRGNVAVNGPLGIGKTSLLQYLAHPAVGEAHGIPSPRFVTVFLDAHSVTPFNSDRFWRRLVRLLARLPAGDLQAPSERLLARPEIDVTDVEELLDALADRDRVLAVLIDEFEWALQAASSEDQSESRNFLAQLASLTRRAPRVMSLVVATERPLFEATRVIDAWRGSPFATVFTSITLKPLDRHDGDRLIDRALADTGFAFCAEDRALLHAYSGGHPAAMQAAAFSLFHGRQQGLDGESLRESARQAARSASPAEEVERAPLPVIDPVASMPAPPAPSGLVIIPETGEVLIDGRRIASLTALEYSLLRLLYDSPGRLCSKEEIIRTVWGAEIVAEVDDSRVEKLISRLRRKIEPAPNRPQYIRTVRGRGYRLVP